MDELQSELIPASDEGESSEQWSALDWLRYLWLEVLSDTNPDIDQRFERLVDSRTVTIRYPTLTQLLGKFMDHRRDTLSIQVGDAENAEAEGRWNARTFCTHYVVPWVAETGQVLGTSNDPYVSNPLRCQWLNDYDTRSSSPKTKEEVDLLVAVLREVQEKDSPQYTKMQLRCCLASLVQKYNKLNIPFVIPQRLSLEATISLTMEYLAKRSGGERLQIITAALMKLIGERFQLFHEVQRQAINEADVARGRSGDITCSRSDGKDLLPVLSIEVKDRDINLQDIEATIYKARTNKVTDVLFISMVPQVPDTAITERVQTEFSLGLNINQSDIRTLLQVILALDDETSRTRYLELIGEELNDRVTQPAHKLAWADLLTNLGGRAEVQL